MVRDIDIASLPVYLDVVRQGARSNGRAASDERQIPRCSIHRHGPDLIGPGIDDVAKLIGCATCRGSIIRGPAAAIVVTATACEHY